MPISYAQNLEDVILWRALKNVERGFYIDIGAQDPIIDSVSLAFYERGWRGVHVEPSAHYANLLRAARPDEEVIEAAIGSSEQKIQFFEFPHTGLSTGDESVASFLSEKGFAGSPMEVGCLPLSKLLDAHGDKDIHWMKIDVEGMERAVIESWLPSRVRPQIVVIESTMPTTNIPSHDAWEGELLRLGYSYVFFDGINRYYVSDRHPELAKDFGLRLSVFDNVTISPSSQNPIGSELRSALRTLSDVVEQLRASNKARAEEIETLQQRVTFLKTDVRWVSFRSLRKLFAGGRKVSNLSRASQNLIAPPKKKCYRKYSESQRLLSWSAVLPKYIIVKLRRRMEKHRPTTKTESNA